MKEELHFSITFASPIAVYKQFENQVQFAIAAGHLKPGDRLPSVVKMSAAYGVNPNTVTKAYRSLGVLGLVKAKRGVGVAILDDAPKLCRQRMRRIVKEHIEEAVAECIACGLSPAEVRGVVSETVESGTTPYSYKKGKR